MSAAWHIENGAHGMYLELSINGQVTLSLVDDGFHEGHVGFYTESANLKLSHIFIEELNRPIVDQDSIYTATTPRPSEMEQLEEVFDK